MVSDSITNRSIPIASSNPKDFAKKKRANRSAKLKQCKLDARREQWLSQVKNKGLKEETNNGGSRGAAKNVVNERERLIEKLEIKPRVEEDNEGLVHHCSDFDSPTSQTSSVLGGNDSGTNFTGSSSGSSGSSSSSSSGGCCSGSVSEEDEEEDDDCLDDWEAVADALAAADKEQEQQNPSLDSHFERDKNVTDGSSTQEVPAKKGSGTDKSKQECNDDRGLTRRPPPSCRAWRPDDSFRPLGLPNLSKLYSFPMNSERHCRRGSVWGCKSLSTPTSCPICCEDLDYTDTRFLPCSCGFRLCLFCHKRILEEDGRCPGCRKQYNQDAVERETTIDGGSLTIRLARSFSMISRS